MHQHISLNSSVYVWTQSPQQKAKIKTIPKRPQSTRRSSSPVETCRNGGCSAANTQSKSYSPNHVDSVQHFYIYTHTLQWMHWGQLFAQRYFNRNMEKPGTDSSAFQSLDAPCSHTTVWSEAKVKRLKTAFFPTWGWLHTFPCSKSSFTGLKIRLTVLCNSVLI